jgi:hypothetical protein
MRICYLIGSIFLLLAVALRHLLLGVGIINSPETVVALIPVQTLHSVLGEATGWMYIVLACAGAVGAFHATRWWGIVSLLLQQAAITLAMFEVLWFAHSTGAWWFMIADRSWALAILVPHILAIIHLYKWTELRNSAWIPRPG